MNRVTLLRVHTLNLFDFIVRRNRWRHSKCKIVRKVRDDEIEYVLTSNLGVCGYCRSIEPLVNSARWQESKV